MSNAEVEKDIRTYVDSELNKRFRGWRVALKGEVLEALVLAAKGMFRWAACQVDILTRKRTSYGIKQALKELPETLDETYEIILVEISQDDRILARTILAWIYANITMELEPMSASVLIEAMHKGASYPPGTQSEYTVSDINSICGCLVTVFAASTGLLNEIESAEEDLDLSRKPSDYRVAFSHYTVHEFLTEDRINTSKANFFAICNDPVTNGYLEVALTAAASFDKLPREPSFMSYCIGVASTAYFI
ncbi:hypothetical protein QQZ08_009142 [Neonectria magnoliae]|uniref:Uncharacterized protein n=1 Tax=Neonectria magnoliae TaxID=2732573 RepID=A0ABR1HQI2_9HYPO